MTTAPALAAGGPPPVSRAVEFGYASIQYSPKFLIAGPSIFEQIDAAAEAGYAWLALDRHTAAQSEREGSLDRLAAVSRERLPCRELHALIITDDVEAVRADAQRLSQQARRFDCPLVLAVVRATVSENAVRGVRAAVEALVDDDTSLGIEFGPLFTVQTLNQAQHVCRAAGGERVGLILDSWHFFHGDESWSDLEAVDPDDLLMVHFSDHGRLGPGGVEVGKDHRLLPGEGGFALVRFVETVRRIGYRGPVEIEVVSAERRAMSVVDWAGLTYRAGSAYWSQDMQTRPQPIRRAE